PVVIAVSGQSRVDDLIAALGKDGHGRVIRANNARLEARGAKAITPYAGFSIALIVGDQQDGKKGATITKIATDIPAQIAVEFLDDHHASGWWPLIWEDLKANGYSVEWSKEASAAIYSGDNGSDEEAELSAPPMENYDHPFDDSPILDPDSDYSNEYAKPAVKPQPSNSLKPLPDA